MRYDAHDTIRSAIHLPFLLGKQRLVIPACDQKHCTPPTTTAFAVMMRSGYNNGGLLRISRCSVFVMNSVILLEYTDCFLWYPMFVSNLCYICTVSYRPQRVSQYVPQPLYRRYTGVPVYRFSPNGHPTCQHGHYWG